MNPVSRKQTWFPVLGEMRKKGERWFSDAGAARVSQVDIICSSCVSLLLADK